MRLARTALWSGVRVGLRGSCGGCTVLVWRLTCRMIGVGCGSSGGTADYKGSHVGVPRCVLGNEGRPRDARCVATMIAVCDTSLTAIMKLVAAVGGFIW